jgi:hypothetical protein
MASVRSGGGALGAMTTVEGAGAGAMIRTG